MHDLAPLKLRTPAVADWSAARLPGRLRSGFAAAHLKAGRVADVVENSAWGLPPALALTTKGSTEALWVGPGEWLLVCPAQHDGELEDLRRKLGEQGIRSVRCESRLHILDLDVPARLVCDLTGLPGGSLAPCRVARTRLAEIAVIIAAASDGAISMIFDRTYAPHVRAWLDRAT